MNDLTHHVVPVTFALTYWVMATGRLPWLQIDRAGMALAAAGLLVALGIVPLDRLLDYIDLPVIITLFALMVVGAHLEKANAFALLGNRLAAPGTTPRHLLALVIGLSAGLSMLLVNDIVVYAMAPLLCTVCLDKGFDPKPHLLGMAAASNAGSAASLIGNPQNILIAEVGHLDFMAHFLFAVVPSATALLVIYFVIERVFRAGLQQITPGKSITTMEAKQVHLASLWLPVAGVFAIVAAYLFAPSNAYQVALLVATALALFGKLNTRELLPAIDVPLLLMIAGLLVVTGSFGELPQLEALMQWVDKQGLLPDDLWSSLAFSVVASNTIGNVPAVALLLNVSNSLGTEALHMLALFSTLAGNLLLTGSLANIITAERAAQHGIQLGFGDFARMGIAVTCISMTLAAVWVLGFGA